MLKYLNVKMSKGFTLIELLVVIFIMAILTIVVLPSYGGTQRKFVLQLSASKIAQDIRMVQEMAMSAQELPGGGVSEGGYGVYFDKDQPNSYIIYAETTTPRKRYNSGEEIEIIYLEEGVKIEEVTPAKTSINFIPPDPTVNLQNNAGDDSENVEIIICIEGTDCSDSANTKSIKVNRVGLVDID